MIFCIWIIFLGRFNNLWRLFTDKQKLNCHNVRQCCVFQKRCNTTKQSLLQIKNIQYNKKKFDSSKSWRLERNYEEAEMNLANKKSLFLDLSGLITSAQQQ